MRFFSTTLIPEEKIVYIYDLIKNIISPGERAFVSPKIQRVVDRVLDERLPDNWRNDEKFIKDLSIKFTDKNFSTYDLECFPEFYAAYYMPNNLYKIQLMILELFKLGEISFSEKKIRILDIGSAIGTTALAVYDFYNILVNVLGLYNIGSDKLPKIEIDSIEKSDKNIEVFKNIRNKLNDENGKVRINDPYNIDVLSEEFNEFHMGKYDITFISNVTCEFSTYNEKINLVKKVLFKLKKYATLILIETALLDDTRDLKKIQYEILQSDDITGLGPCGEINTSCTRCNNCWSFRKENLNIPPTMMLFSKNIDDSDKNEKLKWSYSIFKKQKKIESKKESYKRIKLEDIPKYVDKEISLMVEIVSGKINLDNDEENYYLKICDQSEKSERVQLKIPNYYYLPKYQFGDILELDRADVKKYSNKRKKETS